MKRKVKILYVVSTLKRSGPINVLYNIIQYLNRDRFEPIILTLSPEPKDSALKQFQELRVQAHSLGLSRLKGFLKGPLALRRFVAEQCPDIVHTHGIRADTLSARYLKGFKRVTTLHNYPYQDYLMSFGRLCGSIMAWQHLQAVGQIDFPVACSKTVAKMVQRQGLNLHVIQNGVDNRLYSPIAEEERLILRQKLGLPVDQNVFVSVGHLSRCKDPETVVRGFLSSKAKNNSVLLFVGDGPLRDPCEAIAKGEPRVRFTGRVSNVADYLKAADYLISGSLSEGMPNSVLEGLACGLPVCLSDIDPHREILDLSNRAGVMFTVGDVEDLGKKLNELAKADVKQMSEAALRIIYEHLNAKRMSENYQNLYKQILERS